MADGQTGYGMPIGGVIATKGAIIPNAVGKDIGCGMRVIRTNIRLRDFLKYRKEIMEKIFSLIPVGKGAWHKTARSGEALGALLSRRPGEFKDMSWVEQICLQVGTLGSNNHFLQFDVEVPVELWHYQGIIPIDLLMDCFVTIMVHSGSRNLGAKVADKYDKIAADMNQMWHSAVPNEWDLAFLPIDSSAGKEYRAAMEFALDFAKLNRQMMMETMVDVVQEFFPAATFSGVTDIHHNYAAYENHMGTNVIVHRKGAVKAVGPVIIPGSMETGSYLGEGLSFEKSFKSCSHGAGRELSRKAAKKVTDVQTIVDRMAKNDILILKPEMSDVGEESMESYKDIQNVMECQKDLVKVTARLRAVGVIKG